jgi:hypothetical protein
MDRRKRVTVELLTLSVVYTSWTSPDRKLHAFEGAVRAE